MNQLGFPKFEDTTRWKAVQSDAVALLWSLEPGSVNLIATDTAYESLEKHRKVGTTTRLKNSSASSNEWFRIFPNSRFREFFDAAYRAMSRDSHLYFMCDQETMFAAKPAGEAAGFKFWKGIIWDKIVMGMGYHYRAQHEMVMFFEKGKRRLSNLSVTDILPIRALRGNDLYPTEKPSDLFHVLVDQSSSAGELVVDPFMGSGSCGVAAVRTGRRFIGGDLSPKSIARATDRLRIAETTEDNRTAIEVLHGRGSGREEG